MVGVSERTSFTVSSSYVGGGDLLLPFCLVEICGVFGACEVVLDLVLTQQPIWISGSRTKENGMFWFCFLYGGTGGFVVVVRRRRRGGGIEC